MTNCEQPTCKSVLIHASAVEYKGKGLIFLGPSGTGKSTISQLLASTIEDVRVLADDNVNLDWQTADGWIVSDAKPGPLREVPGVQNTPISAPVPLRAIFRLHQAPLPRLESLRSLEVGRHLINAFVEAIPHHQYVRIEEIKSAFASLSVVAKCLPGYEFYCAHSAQTADVLLQKLNIIV